MNKVITINLNGNGYQVDESGYDALRDYLDGAGMQLEGNPDKVEIIADLEQAVADKCQKYLGSHKTVVTSMEIAEIIEEMGPVDGAAGETGEEQARKEKGQKEKAMNDAGATRRLYQIREGAMLSGVCKGLAVYFKVDVNLVRIVFIALTFATKGLWILAYGALMFVIPHADTSEERASAHGMPFNAQEVIDQAKRTYSDFRNNPEWKRKWRQQRREWRRKWRLFNRSAGWGQNIHRNVDHGSQMAARLSLPVLGVMTLGLMFLAFWVVISLLKTGAVYGWPIPAGVPWWLQVLVVVLLFKMVAWPLNMASRASYQAAGFPAHARLSGSGGVMGLLGTIVIIWLLYQFVPEVHYIIDNLPDILEGIFRR